MGYLYLLQGIANMSTPIRRVNIFMTGSAVQPLKVNKKSLTCLLTTPFMTSKLLLKLKPVKHRETERGRNKN